MKLFICSFIVLGCCLVCAAQSQDKATFSGYIRDASNGEALIGVTVFVQETNSGGTTNEYGFYSITLEKGSYSVVFSYIGFQPYSYTMMLDKNIPLDVNLIPQTRELQEVVVEGELTSSDARNTEMSTNKIDIKTILQMPSFAGENDVLKSILMLPGVSTVGEGSSGFNVRGGSVGQNLTLLDEAPVYNTSHLFGFFSVFNPDATKDVKLYKGAVPARYGGRLSSMLDIRMKEGNSKKFAMNGGIGTIFTRFAVEAPIVKDKGSFIIAGRRSYIDLLLKPFIADLKNTSLFFYDLTLKANYSINAKNRIYLSGYFGRDVFEFDTNQGFGWGNSTATFRWNHLYNDRLFSNTTFVFSRYDYRLRFGSSDKDFFEWKSAVSSFIFKPQFTYFINNNNELDFGGEVTYYIFNPADTKSASSGSEVNLTLEKKYSMEAALYISNRLELNRLISLEYGLRFSHFRSFGPVTLYQYKDTIPGLRKPVLSSKEYKAGESTSSFSNFEPRVSFSLRTGDKSSVKGSYNRTAQYIHFISNTTASNPLDIWVPGSNNLPPQAGDQFALGYFRTFGKDKAIEFSLESYYRSMENQVGYISGADLLLNRFVEGDLLSGIGRAYGLEVYLNKKTGRFNGWLSYTLAKTELQIQGINKGQWYPTRFDRTHNLTFALFYTINNRWSVSSNFIFSTGTPQTVPTSRYWVQGLPAVHDVSESRNNFRLPSYHRLDIAVRLEGKKIKRNGKPKKLLSSWDFSFYNVYSRANAFAFIFSTENNTAVPKAYQFSIINSIVPAVTWNFTFPNN